MLIVGAVVIQFKILSDIIITILCAVLVFQSTVVVSLSAYAIYIQPVDTAAAAATAMKLSTVVKMLVDNAIQEFQSNNINNTITYLQGAEQELSSLIAIAGNNSNINNSASVSTSMAQPLTILLLVKNIIQALDSGDYEKAQRYLNLAEQELGILDVSSSLNPHTIISTSNATYNNSNGNGNYSFFSTYTNTKYGIKLQYPHNWVIEADDYATGAAGQAGILIVSFYLNQVFD